MKITPQTKIVDAIKAHPELIDVLASYNSHFELLKNPIMRKTFARLATVKHAAKVAGVNLTELIKLLNSAIGETVSDADMVEREDSKPASDMPVNPVRETRSLTGGFKPLSVLDPVGFSNGVKAVIEQKHVKTVNLDVRDIMKKGGEPFHVIMQTAAKIKQGEALVLETIFEPAPLYDVLKRRGFEHQTEVLAEEHVRIWFYRVTKKEDKQGKTDIRERIREEGDTVYLDVEGLEPPQPMALILETMAKLDPSKTLVVHHERVPVFLYPKLEERGYKYETHEFDSRNVKLIIKKQ